MAEALIIDGVRTQRGRGRPGSGALSHLRAQRLLAQVLQTLATKCMGGGIATIIERR